MTLRVTANGARLTVPPRTSRRRIEAFLRASQGWVDEQRGRLPSPAAPLVAGDRLAYLDGDLELVLRRSDTDRQRVWREGGSLIARAGGHTTLDALVEGWYRREASSILGRRAHDLAGSLGVGVGRVAIKDTRSRWGSCSSAGTLSFSWRLLLAPERVLDYVVAHEVCHLLRPDHSPDFWSLVRTVHPETDAARAWLRAHGEALHRGPSWRDRAAGLSPS